MRPVVYQLFIRHFSNFNEGGVPWGTRERNGCGSFDGVTDAALEAIARMGATHVWLTGALRHATQTAYEGLPASPACVVKGLAGSPYAVTDYFDVDPDLATEPQNRLQEFRSLLARCRKWGLVPMIDCIPNHVSRCYDSTVRPDLCFGRGDDDGVFFARDNSYYYLEPCHSDVPLRLPDGEFAPEFGRGRVTGNNAATWSPDSYDWYETVKLNYGSDYRHGAHSADALPGVLAPAHAVPRTWRLMDAVLAYWQEMGVGGFRCDMAHMVPMPFWRWVIANCRLRSESVFFMAEAYNDHMKLTNGDVHQALLAAGFNGVYDSAAYQAMRSLFEGGAWANDLDKFNRPDRPLFLNGVRYLENHDEPRLASPLFWAGQGEKASFALMAAHYAAASGPILFYNGQEIGERGDGPTGFGGGNGRTSIFDYTCMPRFQRWTNGGCYDGALLSADEAAMRARVAKLLPLMQHPALAKGAFYGLNWANQQTPGFGRSQGESVSGRRLYAFLRHSRKARSTALVVCNFNTAEPAETCIHIPANAREWAGKKPGVCRFADLLEPSAQPLEATTDELDAQGLPVVVPPGGALLLEWL